MSNYINKFKIMKTLNTDSLQVGNVITLEFQIKDETLNYLVVPTYQIKVLDKSGLLIAISSMNNYQEDVNNRLDRYDRHCTYFELNELLSFYSNLPSDTLFSFVGFKIS